MYLIKNFGNPKVKKIILAIAVGIFGLWSDSLLISKRREGGSFIISTPSFNSRQLLLHHDLAH